jgi:hypothetical protein
MRAIHELQPSNRIQPIPGQIWTLMLPINPS